MWGHSKKTSICKWRKRSLKKPNLLTSWSGTSSFQNCENIDLCCLRYQFMVFCYDSPSQLYYKDGVVFLQRNLHVALWKLVVNRCFLPLCFRWLATVNLHLSYPWGPYLRALKGTILGFHGPRFWLTHFDHEPLGLKASQVVQSVAKHENYWLRGKELPP